MGSENKRAVNTFHKGIAQDIDKHLQPEGSYRYALNGRIRFNTGGGSVEVASKSGATFSFCNETGNKLLISICEGYYILGSCDMENECIVFSTNGINSEIGVINIDTASQAANYFTLFNDAFDPNQDLLHFNINYPITARGSIESLLIKRCYFTDNYSQPRVINLRLFYNEQGIPYHSIFYPNGDYAVPACGAKPTAYPHWLSVHSFAERTDVEFDRIMFYGLTTGNLKTGVYQYAYRYVTRDGHRTVWSLLTRHIFITQDDLPAYNHHYYQMYASNVVTGKGINLNIPKIDTRYDEIEVAYVFSVTDLATEEAAIFFKTKITPSLSTLIVSHRNHSGTPVFLNEFSQIYTWFLKTPTVEVHKNKLIHGGAEMIKPLFLDSTKIQVQPVNRFMLADKLEDVLYSAPPPANLDTEYTQPITNTDPESGFVDVGTFNGANISYSLQNDYLNYKGMLFEHLFTGYWRGETYRFAIVVFDRKGVPFFAQHIADYTFPQQYEGQNLTRWNILTNKYELVLLGAKFSNVVIPADILYDEFGKLNVSGFAIVRTKRDNPRILHQGIILNTVHEPKCKQEDGGIQKRWYTRPLPHISNYFDTNYTNGYPDSHRYDTRFKSECNDWFDDIVNNTDTTKFANRPGTFTYHSPDVLIEERIKEMKGGDYLKLVGTCMKGILPYFAMEVELDGGNNHYYCKMYKTDNSTKRYPMGSESRIRVSNIYPNYETEEGYDPYNNKLKWTPHSRYQAWDDADEKLRAIAHPNTVLMVLKDWESMDIVEINPAYPSGQRSCYHIVNYVVPQTETTALDASIYQPTGHYQPINETVLAAAIKQFDAEGNITGYQFNDIEVWGGDCYVSLFDLCRLYGEFSNCDKDSGMFHDYSVSMIVPIETNYNIAMRFGRSFAKDASNPERTSCENNRLQFKNGIMKEQPEDWNINACLQHEENVQFFYPKPSGVKIEHLFPYRVFNSMQKTYNELDDSFRRFLPFDFSDLQGTYGSITAIATLFDYAYCFQEKGYGVLRINERAIIPTESGQQVVLGTGKDLDGVDYVSTIFGCQHRDSIVRLHHALYWVDARMGKFCRHSQAGADKVSDNYGGHDFFSIALPLLANDELNPNYSQSRKVVGVADYTNNNVIVTIYYTEGRREFLPTTIIFDEDLNVFTSYISATPKIYLAHKNFILSPNPEIGQEHSVYLHGFGDKGHFYNTYYPTKLIYICNPSPNKSCYFDSALINLNELGAPKIVKITHVGENKISPAAPIDQTHLFFPSTDNRFVYRNDKLLYPIRQLKDIDGIERSRLRAHWVEVEMEIENDADNQLVSILSVETNYRLVHRI